MPQGIVAPAGSMAEGPTSHTLFQAAQLTAPQLRLLHRGLDPKRVGKDDKGFAHMEAWDIKRYLLRVFGFAGYDTENRELALVREIEIPGQGQNSRSRWTVVYRAQVRLTVKDVHGRVLGHWDGEAAGGASNQPKLDDAHDMAMKTASSQALKRAATNLGDQFGLSLYNNGSPAPVVGFCAAHPPAEWEKTEAALPEQEDPPVQPEQGLQAAAEPAPEPSPAPAPRPQQASHPAAARQEKQQESREQAFARLTEQYRNCWGNALALAQIRLEGRKLNLSNERVQGPPPESAWTTFDALLVSQVQELEAAQGGGEQRAA
jgi:Rad52/22 family double-strand break repair protein